jgi:hypothetical protein
MLPSDGGGSGPLKPEKKYVSTSSPLKTPSHASYSSANAAEHRARSNPQPPAPPKRKDNNWSAADERAAQHKAIAAREHSKKPTPPPNYSGSANAAEHRLPKPKPATGSAGDLAAAARARTQASGALANFRDHSTLSNKGGLRQETEKDLRKAADVASKRYAAAQAAKAAQDAPAAIPTSLNRGGRRQEMINDARQAASNAKTAYLGSQGLDSSGRPFVVTPPKPTKSSEPKEKHWWDKATNWVEDKAADSTRVVSKVADTTWDATKEAGKYAWKHKSAIGHGALDAAGFIPVVGGVADLANAGWYLAEGDKTNAALSAAAAVPGVGDAVAAAAIAGKVAVKGAKAVEITAKAEKSTEALSGGKDVLKVLHHEGGIGRASLEKKLEKSNWVRTSWHKPEGPSDHVFWTNPARTESVRINSRESYARVYNSPAGGTLKHTIKPKGGWKDPSGKPIQEQALSKDGKPGSNDQTHFPLSD